MADHYRKALELVDEIACKRADLADEYAERGNARRDVIAALHQEIGAAMKLAEVHSHLAIAQRLDDLRFRSSL